MIALLQRVLRAECTVNGKTTGKIGPGLLVFACAEKEDTEHAAVKLAQKVLKYRIFSDAEGKMNLNVEQTGGSILSISQFTLCADTVKGNRPSFTPAAAPDLGRKLYDLFVDELKKGPVPIETGIFGAHMEISLVNDGPVTFWLRISD